MKVEDVIRKQLEEASVHIPLRPMHLDVVMRGGRRRERVQRAVMAFGVAACLVVGAVVINAVRGDSLEGRRIESPVAPRVESPSKAEVKDLMDRFIGRLEAGDAEGSRALLTPAARERAGDMEAWRDAMGPLRAQLDWIAAPDVDVTITSLATGIGPRDIAVFTAPVEEGSALLHPTVVEVVDGEPLLDLASARLRHSITIEPKAPQFFACTPGCDPTEMWPEVTDGMTFSAVLSPAEDVAGAWFAVGGDAWTAEASLTPAGDSFVNAQATFDSAGVQAGPNVFLVVIETADGSLETYGYRVRV